MELPKNFVDLKNILSAHSKIVCGYATTENFTRQVVAGYLEPICYLQKNAAEKLALAEQRIMKHGYSFSLFDAYRPMQAVKFFQSWTKRDDLPDFDSLYFPAISRRTLFEQGFLSLTSSHTRGVAVDLTLIDLKTKKEVEMGTIIDYFGETSETKSSQVSLEVQKRRELLVRVMDECDFKNYSKEWWHFQLKTEEENFYYDFEVKSY